MQRRSPPCQRGVPRHRRGGGIPQSGSFPHGFVLSRSANCESLSHASGVPAPFGKGACGQWPLTMRTEIFCESLLPLQCPVSAACHRTYSLFTLPYSLKTPGICGLEKSLFARGGNYFWGGQAQKRLPGHRKILPVQGRAFLWRLLWQTSNRIREALNKLARAGSVRFFVRQKNGKQGNTVCISCFSFCVDGEKDKLSSRRRFIQSFLSFSLQ